MTRVSKEFKSVGLSKEILANLKSLGYLEMTPIQQKGLPYILNNKDFIGQANTGSGKTAAFALGILSKIDVKNSKPQAIVIVPSRELADQVSDEIRRLARFTNNIKVLTLAGGSDEHHKVKSLKQGAHIIVGTTGRLVKLLETKALNVNAIETLVLDEADRLLESGCIEEINRIASFMPLNRQTMLFSATFPNGIKSLSASIQEDASQVTVDSQHQKNDIKQIFFKATEDKNNALLRILGSYAPESCIIFCNSKETCSKITSLLRKRRIHSLELHSDLEQKDRTLALIKFSNKSCRILVATDIASRGLDIKDVGAIINYDLPADHELYVHRIGRTGRAGQEGFAISLFIPKEREILMAIGKYLKIQCNIIDLNELEINSTKILSPLMSTIYISGGKKNNIRPGDILGALTKEAGLNSSDVGKIQVLEVNSYVAITHESIETAIKGLSTGKIKGKKFKVGKA